MNSNEIAMTIGKNMRAFRTAHGLSQAEVAECLGVTFQQVQKYENGKNRISSVSLAKLRDFYDVPYEAGYAPFVPKNRDWARLASEKIHEIKEPVLAKKVYEIIEILRR